MLSLFIWSGCDSTSNTGVSSSSPLPGGVLPRKSSVVNVPAQEWYIRIVAEDTTNNMKTVSSQLGQLSIANAQVQHSLKALAPFTTAFIDVVFKNPVGLATGEYSSNFHTATPNDSWEFTVKSSDANAIIILSWRGLYVLTPYMDTENRAKYKEYLSRTNPLIRHMKLVDITSGTVTPADDNGTSQVYTFAMIDGVNIMGKDRFGNPIVIGKSKTFRWVLQDTPVVTAIVPKQIKFLKTLRVQALRKDAKATPGKLKRKRLKNFDMMTPPNFEVLVK